MLVVAVHCVAVLCAADVAFAPNIQPMPASITVESNTLVRLDRDQTVSIACADNDTTCIVINRVVAAECVKSYTAGGVVICIVSFCKGIRFNSNFLAQNIQRR